MPKKRLKRTRVRFIAQMRRKILLLFIPVLLSAAGCDIVNPDESTPTYVKIDSFNMVINNPTKEGSAAHNITSAWMYYNNELVGIYDLPCNVPVITNGDKGELAVIPGITLNGLVSLQPSYPFYRVDTTTLVSKPGGVTVFTPQTSYLSTSKFPYKEDFEVGNSFQPFIEGAVNETAIRRTTDKEYVFEAGGAGLIELNSTTSYSESISKTGFNITQGESFIEINYKGTAPFEVGLYNTLTNGTEAYQYLFGVKASDTWKKIYIELASYTSANKGKDHKVIIKAELPEGQSEAYVALDNIKVLSF